MAAATEDASGATCVAGVRLTHPERVLYARMGVTKGDLARYYERIAEHMLPHLVDRPVSLVRCPQGSHEDCFFQKHAGSAVGDEIDRVEITGKSGKTSAYLVVGDVAALVACAQIGALELHVWAARRDRLERPDRLVFDLDPGEGVAFAEVRRAAADLRDVLERAGLESFALLTGGKGVHLVCPIERRKGWRAFAAFAKAFATKMASLDPDRFLAGMAKAERSGRIFIDYLRNVRGSTAVAPFSPRAREGAPVAAPVAWDELAKIEASSAFSLSDGEALAERATAWKEYSELRQRLTKAGAARIGLALEDEDEDES